MSRMINPATNMQHTVATIVSICHLGNSKPAQQLPVYWIRVIHPRSKFGKGSSAMIIAPFDQPECNKSRLFRKLEKRPENGKATPPERFSSNSSKLPAATANNFRGD